MTQDINQPGGSWHFDMVGLDGTKFANRSVFEEVGAERIVLRHLDPVHKFTADLAMQLVEIRAVLREPFWQRFVHGPMKLSVKNRRNSPKMSAPPTAP